MEGAFLCCRSIATCPPLVKGPPTRSSSDTREVCCWVPWARRRWLSPLLCKAVLYVSPEFTGAATASGISLRRQDPKGLCSVAVGSARD